MNSTERWFVYRESYGKRNFAAERWVNGKKEFHDGLRAHCLACAKMEVMVKWGGVVDGRGGHNSCSMILRAQIFIMRQRKEIY